LHSAGVAFVVELGPVPSTAAIAWIESARDALRSVREHRSALPFAVPPEVVATFIAYLDDWERAARRSPVFTWAGVEDVERARMLVQYWFNIDSLDDVTSRRIGIRKPRPEARPFLVTLVKGVVRALEQEATCQAFVHNLIRGWPTAAACVADSALPV
jgi:hypothetical protein